jgi:dipeptidyl aminopeptidase/acylaminoacyl peptidase
MRQALLSSLASLLVAAGAAGQDRPFDARDLVAMARVSDLQAAPDRRTLAFVLRETDMEANRGRTDVWLLDLASGQSRRLTRDPANDTMPRWSPDGQHLYFLSARGESTQVWRIPLAGGEAEQVTRLPVDVNAFAISPAGDRLAVSMDVFTDCADVACTEKRLAERADDKSSAQRYDRLFVRHWDTWADGRRAVLHSIPLGEDGLPSGAPVALTAALDADVPGKPFGGPEDFTFSPDGRSIFASARRAGTTEPWSTNFDIWRIAADGAGAPENLTTDNPAWDAEPVVSPDGRLLAYRAMARPGYESDRFVVVVRDLKSGETRRLTADWDRSPDRLWFAPSGGTLYATAQHVGEHPLWRIDLRTGDVRMVAGGGHVQDVALAGDRVVFTRDDLTSPADIYVASADGRNVERLTQMNAARLAGVRMGRYEQFSFAGAGDETVYGYVVTPATGDLATRHPVAFLIHGGPQGSFGNHFHYRWNPQTYAGAGFGVVMIDFHGSTGYGQAFTDAINDDWGGKPLEDLKRGLAAALERYPWLDGERVCALGGSYGGYMVNWIAGQWPERFRCLVNHDGIFDHRMMYYATEELWFPEWEHGGPEYENPRGYAKDNPVDHVARWRAPMLVIHGGLDYRVPDTQGIATFTALQRRGIPSEFLYFPDENHWVLKPHNSIRWHDTVNAWLTRWLSP